MHHLLCGYRDSRNAANWFWLAVKCFACQHILQTNSCNVREATCCSILVPSQHSDNRAATEREEGSRRKEEGLEG